MCIWRGVFGENDVVVSFLLSQNSVQNSKDIFACGFFVFFFSTILVVRTPKSF